MMSLCRGNLVQIWDLRKASKSVATLTGPSGSNKEDYILSLYWSHLVPLGGVLVPDYNGGEGVQSGPEPQAWSCGCRFYKVRFQQPFGLDCSKKEEPFREAFKKSKKKIFFFLLPLV